MDKILFYKDINENSAGLTEDELGRKGQSLALLAQYRIQVPPFFILGTALFKEFMTDISKNVQIGTLEELKKEIIATPLPQDYTQMLMDSYSKLSGFGKAWVAVRASISSPKYPHVSFSGQLDTFLNIRDVSEIELAIKEIYASLFSENVYEYLKKNNISYSEVSVGIIVQKMIQAEVSGIMYTFDPITLNKNNVSIEAVFGLGDVLNDGTINPDIYVVSKSNYEIVEKRIVPQEWMKVRRIGDISSLEHVQKIKISKVWQYSQKIDEALIKELASIGNKIESIIDPFQIIEWTMEGGTLWVLQVKAVSPKLMAQEPQISVTENRVVEIENSQMNSRINQAMTPGTPIKRKKEPEEIEETLLFLGNPASSGVAYGKALVVSSEILKQDSLLQALLEECTKDTILVTEEFSGKLEPFFYKIGGVITNYGGINSDAAITARELGLPAIVGTRIATVFIQNNTLLKVDGSSGTVHRVNEIPDPEKLRQKESKQHKITTQAAIATEPEEKKQVQLPENLDEAFRLFVPSYMGSSHYLYLDEGSKYNPDLDYAGVALTTKDLNALIAKKIKKIKNGISGSVFVILEDHASLDAVMEKKRKLSAYNVRRSRKVKIILEVATFFSLLNLERFVNLNIDGFLFNLEKLNMNYGLNDSQFDDNLFDLMNANIQKIKKVNLDILAATVPSTMIRTPLSREVQVIAKSGCNALFVSKGDKMLSNDEIQQFSHAFKSAVLRKD